MHLNRLPQSGFVTLSFLFIAMAILWIVFMARENLIYHYQKIALVQKQAINANLILQKQILDYRSLPSACLDLPLEKNKFSAVKFFNYQGFKQGIWCKFERLLDKFPKKNITENADFIDTINFAKFGIFPSTSPVTLDTNNKIKIIYLNQPHNQVQVNGKVKVVIFANGKLTFSGNGEIQGLVITSKQINNLQHLSKEDFVNTCIPNEPKCNSKVKFSYDKQVGDFLSVIGKWHLMENSWHDFQEQYLTE